MMSGLRFLFVSGCLMAALVAFTPDAAFAQAEAVDDLAAAARSHDTIRLTWTNSNVDLDKFSLRYQASDSTNAPSSDMDFDTTMNIQRMDIEKTTNTVYSYMVEDLMPGQRYIFQLATLASTGVDPNAKAYAFDTTHTADAPDDVMNLMLTASDAMIMAMWDEATDYGSPVTGYSVEYREEGTSGWTESRDGTKGMNTSAEWALSNLTNGTTYEVRVQACSFDMCGDWTDEEEATPGMTPTPALPIFGAFALGAGVLAAGRRRLRRRQQLLNS